MPSLGYCTVGSNDLERAKVFYGPLLASIGFVPIMELPDGGRLYGDGTSMFGVLMPYDRQAARAGNGTMSGFRLDDGGQVRDFHARALELGGANEGDPGERAPGVHFAYFRDPDGNKLCAYSMG